MIFLFNFFGPEILIILVALGILIFGIVMIFKILKRLFTKKASSNSNSNDKIGQLERLAALKQKGLLTDAEFQREKNKLL